MWLQYVRRTNGYNKSVVQMLMLELIEILKIFSKNVYTGIFYLPYQHTMVQETSVYRPIWISGSGGPTIFFFLPAPGIEPDLPIWMESALTTGPGYLLNISRSVTAGRASLLYNYGLMLVAQRDDTLRGCGSLDPGRATNLYVIQKLYP